MSPEALLYAQAAAALYLTGLLWFVQLVHYPMMAEVPAESFVAWERANVRRTALAVGPMMLVEVVTALAMVAWPPTGVPGWVGWAGLALLAIMDGSTALYFGPLHGRLAAGFDEHAHRSLVRWNWLRTFGWTARGLLTLYALALTRSGD